MPATKNKVQTKAKAKAKSKTKPKKTAKAAEELSPPASRVEVPAGMPFRPRGTAKAAKAVPPQPLSKAPQQAATGSQRARQTAAQA